MFNKKPLTVIKQLVIFCLFLLVFMSCEKDVSITFKETLFTPKTAASIEILYPKVKESHAVANQINSEIERYISQQVSFKDSVNLLSIKDATTKFDNAFIQFKNDFPKTSQQWELNVEGEVLYKSLNVICIGMSSYMYTGGAHGNDRIDFLNFNPENGILLSTADVINNLEAFGDLVETHLKQEIETGKNESITDYFFGEDFKLPQSLGFNEEGLIILYNKYEIASYAQGITEFIIPYNEVRSYLKIIP